MTVLTMMRELTAQEQELISALMRELEYAFAEMLARAEDAAPEILEQLAEDWESVVEVVSVYGDQLFWTAVAEIERTLREAGLCDPL